MVRPGIEPGTFGTVTPFVAYLSYRIDLHIGRWYISKFKFGKQGAAYRQDGYGKKCPSN